MFFFFGRNGRSITSRYNLYDRFTTDRAAGAVNGTSAEPVGGTRTVTDTNSKISIANGVLSFATGAVTSDRVSYGGYSTAAGNVLLSRASITNDIFRWGWHSSGESLANDAFNASGSILRIHINGGAALVVGTFASPMSFAIVKRLNGFFYFEKSQNWKLSYVSAVGGAATQFVVIEARGTTCVGTFDNIRVPKRLYIPVPLQSDGMSASTTDGAGNAEANGLVGNAYTNVGTWGVSGGARFCSALSGGLGFSYLPCTSSNVIIDAEVTRSAGVAGIVARYASATDYLIAYHDGTNAKLDKVVGGVTTNLVSAAATYSAGAVLRLVLDDTTARLFYNNAAVGSAVTTPAAGSLNHGLYTTDIGNTFDDLIVWARGNEGQYNGLDSL